MTCSVSAQRPSSESRESISRGHRTRASSMSIAASASRVWPRALAEQVTRPRRSRAARHGSMGGDARRRGFETSAQPLEQAKILLVEPRVDEEVAVPRPVSRDDVPGEEEHRQGPSTCPSRCARAAGRGARPQERRGRSSRTPQPSSSAKRPTRAPSGPPARSARCAVRRHCRRSRCRGVRGTDDAAVGCEHWVDGQPTRIVASPG